MPFCSKCGTEIFENMNFCQKCGNVTNSANNTQNSANAGGGGSDDGAIWNPSVAASLGLLLPTLAIILHHLNWKTLGQEEKAKSSLIWAIASIVCLLAVWVMQIPFLSFFVLILWYFISGKGQITYVKDKFKKEYKRKPWTIPVVVLAVYLFFELFLVIL